MAEVAAALGLPAYFGGNLDALEEALADLTEPTALVLVDWTRLPRSEPAIWSELLDLLPARTASPPAFAVLLA